MTLYFHSCMNCPWSLRTFSLAPTPAARKISTFSLWASTLSSYFDQILHLIAPWLSCLPRLHYVTIYLPFMQALRLNRHLLWPFAPVEQIVCYWRQSASYFGRYSAQSSRHQHQGHQSVLLACHLTLSNFACPFPHPVCKGRYQIGSMSFCFSASTHLPDWMPFQSLSHCCGSYLALHLIAAVCSSLYQPSALRPWLQSHCDGARCHQRCPFDLHRWPCLNLWTIWPSMHFTVLHWLNLSCWLSVLLGL